MKAMILAAGFGTRLGEIGKKTPKCLVSAGGKTMLEHNLRLLKQAGVTEVVINLHHLAEQVREFIKTHDFGVKIHLSHEEKILGTGGGVKHAAKFLEDSGNFLLINADVFTDFNLNLLVKEQQDSQALATLAVMQRSASRALIFDQQHRLLGWDNLKTGESKIITESSDNQRLPFCGIHCISTKIFKYLQQQIGEFSIIESYLNAAQAGQVIKAYQIKNQYWIDVGTIEKLAELERHLQA